VAFSAEVIADSITPEGHRLTTIEVSIQRDELAQLNKHRVISNSAESLRAMPVSVVVRKALDDPAMPLRWNANQQGMQAGGALHDEDAERADKIIRTVRDVSILGAVALNGGVERLRDPALQEDIEALQRQYPHIQFEPLTQAAHKENANRILAPHLYTRVLLTATEWVNFFALRANEQAQPEIQRAARLMIEAMAASTPTVLRPGQWHLPYVLPEERSLPAETQLKLSAARCARISYSTHGTTKPNIEKDIALADRLRRDGHMTPFEHQATPMGLFQRIFKRWSANFQYWNQYRQNIPGQAVFDPNRIAA